MSKRGFNENELIKTIVTKIDKDGFHERTVTYGKDSDESGSEDWSIAHVTFTNSKTDGGVSIHVALPAIAIGDTEHNMDLNSFGLMPFNLSGGASITADVPLYKGKCEIGILAIFPRDGGIDSTVPPVVTGEIEIDEDQNSIVITGDGTVTVSSVDNTPDANPDE